MPELVIPPIEHVVVIIQENSTYDRLYGRLGRGLGDSTLAHDTDPPSVPYAWDPTHGHWWSGKYHEWNDYHGQLDRNDLPLYYEWADKFALCDTAHAELFAPSYWNHAAFIAAGSHGWIDNPPPTPMTRKLGQIFRGDPKQAPPLDSPTLPEAMDAKQLTWRNYGDGTFQKFQRIKDSPNNLLCDDFAVDARLGQLPTLSYLHPGFKESEHSPEPVANGMLWVAKQLQAIVDGGLWEKTVVFVIPDDWGGFYDHVPAPELPVPTGGDRSDSVRLGPRVPITVISPYSKAGYLTSERGGLKSFRSVVRWIRELYGIPPLDEVSAAREAQVDSMWDCFDFKQKPLDPPRTTLLPGEMKPRPKEFFLRRMATSCVTKAEANVRFGAIAMLWSFDNLRFAKPITGCVRKALGLDNPKLANHSHQGWPSTKLGAAFLLPLAAAVVPLSEAVDLIARFAVAHGVTGFPVEPAGVARRKALSNVVKTNQMKAIFPGPHAPHPMALADRPAAPEELPPPPPSPYLPNL